RREPSGGASAPRRHRHRLRNGGARSQGRGQAVHAPPRPPRGARLPASRRLRSRHRPQGEPDGAPRSRDSGDAPHSRSLCAPRPGLRRVMAESETPLQPIPPLSAEPRNLPVPISPAPERDSFLTRLVRAIFGWKNGSTRADIAVAVEAAGSGETGVS